MTMHDVLFDVNSLPRSHGAWKSVEYRFTDTVSVGAVGVYARGGEAVIVA